MQSLWNPAEAPDCTADPLAARVYSSQLLGREPSLVLHGGGNTSVKARIPNILGDEEEILYIKGSGWDLATIDPGGFAPTRLTTLQRLAALPSLSDTDMMRELKAACTDPAAPTPSVEAILHAIMPPRFVDHTHADAVVAISNTPDGETLLRSIYGDEVLILPYVMPGFVLAQQVYVATRSLDWSTCKGIILLHHGVFTFADDAHSSYGNMIAIVDRAEQFLRQRQVFDQVARSEYLPTGEDLLYLAGIRQQSSQLFGRPMLAQWDNTPAAVGYSALPGIERIATRGPVTPDHTLHTKRTAMVVTGHDDTAVSRFADEYADYFARHDNGQLTCLDRAPRVGVWQGRGMLYFAPNAKRLRVVADIATHTRRAVQWGEALGGWQALPQADIFALEYWELEQAKLKNSGGSASFEGRVALVTGAASGIGHACAEALLVQGACVVALDINPAIITQFVGSNALGLVCDVTDTAQLRAAVLQTVQRFGGLDIMVSNAGFFPPSAAVSALDDAALEQSLALNFTSHAHLLREAVPFLQRGCDPVVVVVASKNVPAPGPGALAYSSAKAALTQMVRVAALELGQHGIRVNAVHPNAVFDTALWDEATLQARAQAYGLDVDAYKCNNVLRREVTSAQVAATVLALCGPAFACTTGAQIPVDGGNERVI